MSHINAIHGKRHIVVCITHHETKFSLLFWFYFWGKCAVHAYVLYTVTCRPLYGLFNNENRFLFIWCASCWLFFFFFHLLSSLSYDVAGSCVQILLSQAFIVDVCRIIFITFLHVNFLLFYVFFNWLVSFLSGNWKSEIWVVFCIFVGCQFFSSVLFTN